MIDMSESWIGRGELGARTARAEQHDLSSRDRLDDPLTDLVPYVNEHRRRVAELQRGEVAAVAGDRGAEHERLELGARTARAEQHDLSSRDRLDDPLTDLVPYVNEHRRRVAELQRGEVAAVAGD